tara:strand:- start:235 stop:654 length:420 start_codon:yes stop_codon:yes gene_type:complete
MYAIVDYKGSQILLEEGKKTRVPFIKDSKEGSVITFDNILFFDDGKQKKTGNPYLKNVNLKAKVLSHEKGPKIMIFKQKRRKGHQKKNGYKDNFTLIQIDKLSTVKQVTKAKPSSKKTVAKKSTSKAATKKTTTKTSKK